MQFNILLLLASTALAVSGVDTAPDSVEMQDKRNFVFPDDVDDVKKLLSTANKPIKFLPDVPEQQKVFSKEGVLCYRYRDYDIRIIPDECLKAVYCDSNLGTHKRSCPKGRIQNYTRAELLKLDEECVVQAICDPEDRYESMIPYSES